MRSSSCRGVPSETVDMVLTSPPYFRLRDYHVTGQIGLEAEVEQWVAALRAVAAEVHRVLTPTGSFWLNVADTYSTNARQGAGRKSLLLGPERLALALLEDGWLLRNKIVWQKANPMPTSVTDRLSCTWEALYVFVKQPQYYFNLDAMRVPHTSAPPKRRDRVIRPRGREAWRGPNGDDASGLKAMRAQGRVGHPLGQEPRRRLADCLHRLPGPPPRHLSGGSGRAGDPRRLPGGPLRRLPPAVATADHPADGQRSRPRRASARAATVRRRANPAWYWIRSSVPARRV